MTSRLDNVIFIDSDIKLLSPLPLHKFDQRWEHYDAFLQDEGNDIFPKHPCTGFMGLKFCEANISLLEALHREHCTAIVSSESQHDQNIFCNYISRDINRYKKLYFLPQMLFPVGYMGPIYRDFNTSDVILDGQSNPILYHANWVIGTKAKAALMDGFQVTSENKDSESDDELDEGFY